MGKKKETAQPKSTPEKDSAEVEKTEAPTVTVEDKEVVQLKEQIKKLEEDNNTQKEAYLRLAAEYDNFRKRTQAEKLSIYDDATAKAVSEILPIADSLDMATQNLGDVPEQYSKGLKLVTDQFKSSLEKLKVEPFGELGDEFNPEIHNAISKIESEDFEENKISQVFQRGYKISDKIIRHAMVQVANCD